MSNPAAQFALSAATIATGGGLLAIVKLILTRRETLKNMGATAAREESEAEKGRAEAERIRAETAAAIARGLAEVAQIQVTRNREQEKYIDELLAEATAAHAACESRLRAERRAEARAREGLVRELATLRSALEVAQQEIRDLKAAASRDPNSRTREDDR